MFSVYTLKILVSLTTTLQKYIQKSEANQNMLEFGASSGRVPQALENLHFLIFCFVFSLFPLTINYVFVNGSCIFCKLLFQFAIGDANVKGKRQLLLCNKR